MRRFRTILACATLVAVPPCILAGCTADGPCVDDGIPRAQCLVCKKNGDLACVCVKVLPDTPRCAYEGETYYFCSDDCRREFLRDPARYLPMARRGTAETATLRR